MTQHTAQIELVPVPHPQSRSLAKRLHDAAKEWREVEKANVSYETRRTTLNATILSMALERMVDSLIDEPALKARLLQHFEQQLKNEFPSPQGSLLS